jgi:hypothetical protein
MNVLKFLFYLKGEQSRSYIDLIFHRTSFEVSITTTQAENGAHGSKLDEPLTLEITGLRPADKAPRSENLGALESSF